MDDAPLTDPKPSAGETPTAKQQRVRVEAAAR